MIVTSTRKDEALDRLTGGIAQLTSSDKWTAWLRVQARFHSYSFSNTILILVQRPAAWQVSTPGAGSAGSCAAVSSPSGFWLPSPAE